MIVADSFVWSDYFNGVMNLEEKKQGEQSYERRKSHLSNL